MRPQCPDLAPAAMLRSVGGQSALKTQLTRAWCDEMGEEVTIDDAYRFATSFTPPIKLTFRCPDRLCREQTGALVAGANYKVDLPRGGRKRMRYFRAVADQVHRIDCTALISLESRKGKLTQLPGHDATKVSDVIDRFAPRSGDGPPPEVQASATRPSRGTTHGRLPASGVSEDHRLDRLMAVHERLQNYRARRSNALMIDGRPTNYADAFASPRSLTPTAAPVLVFGGANLRFVRAESSWLFTFFEDLQLFPGPGYQQTLTVRMSLDRLEGSAAGLQLMSRLHEYKQKSMDYLDVAAYGTVHAIAEGGYAMLLDSLFNFAMRPRRTHRTPHSSSSQ
jgi:hypothetical protein